MEEGVGPMDFLRILTESVVALLGVILFAAWLRNRGILKEEHGALFARLVTDLTLPAMIFVSLARTPVRWAELQLPPLMLLAEGLCLVLAWLVAKTSRLPRAQVGAFVLAAAFGSSAFLGYALAAQVFAGDAEAVSDVVITSELGVGSAIFTVGVLVAMVYGSEGGGVRRNILAGLAFFRSPIFISLVLGIVFSQVTLPMENPVVATVFRALDALAQANTLLVMLTVGVMLRFRRLGASMPLVLAACAIKLVVEPLAAYMLARGVGCSEMFQKVLMLEAAMPAATLSVVLSRRHGCDSELASLLVFATTLMSAGTIIVLFLFL